MVRTGIAGVFGPALESRPEAEAVLARSGSLTYAELDQQADRAAAALYSLGVRPGDRVAATLPNDLDVVLAFHGTMRAGGIWVGIGEALAGPEKDHLLADCDPSLVTFEIAISWLVTGGRDPLAYLAKYPGRFPMVHAKDRTADGRMADVGTGVIDFPEILAAFKRGGLQHCFVERDDAPDPFASARASFAYLDALTF